MHKLVHSLFELLPQNHNVLNQLLSKVAKVVAQPLNLISFQSIQMDHMGHLQITHHSLEIIPEAFCVPPCWLCDTLWIGWREKWHATRERAGREWQMIALFFLSIRISLLAETGFYFTKRLSFVMWGTADISL